MITIILIGFTLALIIGIVYLATKEHRLKGEGIKKQIDITNYNVDCTLTLEKLNKMVKDVYAKAEDVGYWQERTFEDDEVDIIYSEAKAKYDSTLNNLS